MTGRGRFVHAAVACAGAMLLFIDSGQATDLNGVWASDPAVCNKVFVTKAGKISFRRDADLHGSGFIIDGQRIRGRVATCKLLRTKVEVPVVHMIASCATDVMLSNVQLTVRVLEPDKINRVFPGLEDMEMPFYRCPIGKENPNSWADAPVQVFVPANRLTGCRDAPFSVRPNRPPRFDVWDAPNRATACAGTSGT